MTVSAVVKPLNSPKWVALALVVAAQFMVVLDISIVNVALPAMRSDLHFSQAGLQWVISAYALTFGGFLLLGGRLADLLGRRRLFITGIVLFTLSSMLCGIAWSATSLVVFRAIQGVGGALFAPAGLSLLMTTFTEGRPRNLALGIWGAASGSGAAVGVLLGGVLTSYLTWPWVFFINVPVGLAVALLSPRKLTESRVEGAVRHFDVAGASAITSSLMLLVYGLTKATQDGWGSVQTVGTLVAAAALAVGFVAIERRAASPLLPFAAFRGNTLGVGGLIATLIASIAFSQFFLLTLYLQNVLHYSAARTGLAFLAIAGTVAITSNVAQRLVSAFGPRRVLAAGLVSAAIAQLMLIRLPTHANYFTDLLPSFLLIGIGIGFGFVAVTIASLQGVAPIYAGVASGIVNVSRQIGGAVGLAAMTTVASTIAGSSPTANSIVHGDHVAFGILGVLALAGAALTPTLRPHIHHEQQETFDYEPAFEEAA